MKRQSKDAPGQGVQISGCHISSQYNGQNETEPDNPQQRGNRLDINTLKADERKVKQGHNFINRRATMLDDEDEDEWDDMYVSPHVVDRDIAYGENDTGIPVEQGQWLVVPHFHRT